MILAFHPGILGSHSTLAQQSGYRNGSILEDRKLSCKHGSQMHLVEDCKDDGTARRTGLGLG